MAYEELEHENKPEFSIPMFYEKIIGSDKYELKQIDKLFEDAKPGNTTISKYLHKFIFTDRKLVDIIINRYRKYTNNNKSSWHFSPLYYYDWVKNVEEALKIKKATGITYSENMQKVINGKILKLKYELYKYLELTINKLMLTTSRIHNTFLLGDTVKKALNAWILAERLYTRGVSDLDDPETAAGAEAGAAGASSGNPFNNNTLSTASTETGSNPFNEFNEPAGAAGGSAYNPFNEPAGKANNWDPFGMNAMKGGRRRKSRKGKSRLARARATRRRRTTRRR